MLGSFFGVGVEYFRYSAPSEFGKSVFEAFVLKDHRTATASSRNCSYTVKSRWYTSGVLFGTSLGMGLST